MASGNGKHVLLVEDDASIRSVLSEVLADDGYRVATVCNGREAIDYLLSNDAPGLVLLDMMMPVMNGWEFLAERSKDERLSHFPILVLSGDRDVTRKASAFQIVGCVDKPVRLDPLLDAVASHYGMAPVDLLTR